MHLARCALFFALLSKGNSIAAKMAMMAITTNNSINVKAGGLTFGMDIFILGHMIMLTLQVRDLLPQLPNLFLHLRYLRADEIETHRQEGKEHRLPPFDTRTGWCKE